MSLTTLIVTFSFVLLGYEYCSIHHGAFRSIQERRQ
jgi:hypothetical protein